MPVAAVVDPAIWRWLGRRPCGAKEHMDKSRVVWTPSWMICSHVKLQIVHQGVPVLPIGAKWTYVGREVMYGSSSVCCCGGWILSVSTDCATFQGLDVPNHFILLLKAFAPRATSAVVERTVVDSYAGMPFHVAVEQRWVCKSRSITARVWTLEAVGDK